jgi:hypothetical protein
MTIVRYWVPEETGTATATADIKVNGSINQGFTVDCDAGSVKSWSEGAQLIGPKTSVQKSGQVGPIGVGNKQTFDPGSARASDAMNVSVTLSDDGKSKTIKWDVDGSAVVENEISFKLEGAVGFSGWEIGANFNSSSSSRVLLKGSGKGVTTCTCKDGKWE